MGSGPQGRSHAEHAAYDIGRVQAQHPGNDGRAQDERGDAAGLVGEALDELLAGQLHQLPGPGPRAGGDVTNPRRITASVMRCAADLVIVAGSLVVVVNWSELGFLWTCKSQGAL